MPGSTQLNDLPGGPPDNHGYDDSDILDNIIDQVSYEEEGQDVEAQPQQYQNETPQYQTHYQYQPKRNPHQYNQPQPRSQPTLQEQVNKSNNMEITNGGILDNLLEKLKEPLIVSFLVYFSNTEIFIETIDRLLPRVLKLFNENNEETFSGLIVKSLIIGLIYYFTKLYFT